MNVVVTGWVVPFPGAGLLWHYVQFVLGFQQLGHRVWYLEDSGDWPWGWDHERNTFDPTCRHGTTFLGRELGGLGLGDRWVYRHMPSGEHVGMSAAETEDVLRDADVFVNVSCSAPRRPEYERIPHRLAIDTDPVFTQVKIAAGEPHWGELPEWHTRMFTFGRPPLPGQRAAWVPTRQPVSTAHWPVAASPPSDAALTTIAAWRSYPPVHWEGRTYGAKDRTWAALLTLPDRVSATLSVALGPGAGREVGEATLGLYGWDVVDGYEHSRSTAAYRTFIHGSIGELGICKHGYVAARSGWFSERTCAYLASGRPAIVQDTGWTAWLEHGKGLLAFSSVDDAVAAIEDVLADPVGHRLAARRLVGEHFEAASVCRSLLEACL